MKIQEEKYNVLKTDRLGGISNLIHLRELLPDQVQLNKSNYEQF